MDPELDHLEVVLGGDLCKLQDAHTKTGRHEKKDEKGRERGKSSWKKRERNAIKKENIEICERETAIELVIRGG